jgi:hypothetical protein
MESAMAQPKPFDDEMDDSLYTRVDTGAPVLTPEESRQGVISGRVLMILTTSLALAAIAFAIVYSIFF